MRIKYWDIGRGKHSGVLDLDTDDEERMEVALIRECSKFLMSRGIDVTPPTGDQPGAVLAGFHCVGHWQYEPEIGARR